MDDEPTGSKKRKPSSDENAAKKRKDTQAEKPRRKRQIQDEQPDEPAAASEQPRTTKKKVSFQFEELAAETPREEPAQVPPNWQQYMNGAEPAQPATPRRKNAKAAPKKRVSKKPKKELVDISAEDYLQFWDYELNEQKTEPVMGLRAAIEKANRDNSFKILKASEMKDGDRMFGRRLLLKSEFYLNRLSQSCQNTS